MTNSLTNSLIYTELEQSYQRLSIGGIEPQALFIDANEFHYLWAKLALSTSHLQFNAASIFLVKDMVERNNVRAVMVNYELGLIEKL